MKQEKNTSSEVSKVVSLSQSTTTPTSRLKASSLRTKDSPNKPEVSPGGLKAKPRSVLPTHHHIHIPTPTPTPTPDPKVRRSLGLNNRPKSGEDVMNSQKGREIEEVKILGRSGNRPMVEQFSRLRRRQQSVVVADPNGRRNEDETDREKKELLERVNSSEILVKSLQSEVLELKNQLDKLQNLNVELESKNKQFAKDLAVAEAKISVLSSQNQGEPAAEKRQTSNFKDVQKLMAIKLENLGVNKNVIKEKSTIPKPSALISNPITKVADVQQKVKASLAPLSPMPPPPPPPPLPRISSRASTTKKAPTLVEFYHTLTKHEGRKDVQGPGIPNNRMTNFAHNSIVGEIQNRSSHLLAIKSDIETKGEFIKLLIEKIHSATYTDIEDVLQFVGWLDRELSSLADERAVLRHFNWPEKKADSMREAAIEYRDLKQLESEVSTYKDDSGVSCEVALKKIASLLDKSERSIQRLVKLRDSTMLVYRNCKIPTDWMLDSGMVHKIKQASMNLAKIFMKRVSMELQSVRNSERESTQEALLLQGVRFAYRAHQFSGGLDSETMRAFEDIRQRVPMNVGGSRELLAGIRSQ